MKLKIKIQFQFKKLSFKKITISLLKATLLLTIIWDFSLTVVHAQTFAIPIPPAGNYGGSVQDPGTGGRPEDRFSQLIVGAVMNIRFVIGAVAVLMTMVASFRLATAMGNEEVFENQKKTLVWAILGFALVGFAGDITRILSVGECPQVAQLPGTSNIACIKGGFLRDPNTIVSRISIFEQRTELIITCIKYLIGSIAVLMLMRNAIRLIANSSPEELEKDKKNIIWILIGLFLIIIADNVISNVLYSIDTTRYPTLGSPQPAINFAQGIKEIVGFTNFIVALTSPIAILALVVGGGLYVVSAGNEETQGKAKRLIFTSLIGLLIIYGSFAIVSTFIARRAIDQPSLPQSLPINPSI